MTDEVKENNKQLVCEIKIDAEMMRKIIDEKMAQIELDIQEIRAKAIDEFADRLSKYLNVESATKYGNKDAEQQRNSYDTLMKYEIADAIDDIAEQMKAGVDNGNK